jgi:hypothetical protein
MTPRCFPAKEADLDARTSPEPNLLAASAKAKSRAAKVTPQATSPKVGRVFDIAALNTSHQGVAVATKITNFENRIDTSPSPTISVS